MPALRRFLTVQLIGALLAVALAFAVVDAVRPPERQVLARAWVKAVRGYQRVVRPIIRGMVQCRFTPTCSEYSAQAVARFGIAKGLVLTARRLVRCTPSRQPPIHDPVPPRTPPHRWPWSP